MSLTVEKNAHVWERDGLDWYVEPSVATRQLASVETFDGLILDPCCGGGNIVSTLRAAGLRAYGSDIVRRVSAETEWFLGEHDFLAAEADTITRWPNIVMNPPFFRAKGAEAFIRKAVEISTAKVCAFLDIKFLAGATRAEGLFADLPPARIWILTPRPSCPPGEYLAAGNVAGGGTADWVWAVWDHAHTGPTQLGWLKRLP
jgi:predicted RNA methylase